MDAETRHRVLVALGLVDPNTRVRQFRLRAEAELAGVTRHGTHNQKDHGRRGPRGLAKAAAKKAVKGAATLVSERVVGKDLVDDIAADIRDDPGAVSIRNMDNYDSPFDLHLQAITRRQGFDAKPRVGTRGDVDAAVAGGWVEVWRGVQDNAADINDRLRNGEFEPGHGTYGNGIYTSTRRVTAERYRGRWISGSPPESGDYDLTHVSKADVEPDSMMRIAIDPHARVGTWEDVQAEHKAWLETVAEGSLEATVLSDPGRFAAARGYDVLLVTGQDDGGQYPPNAGEAPFAAQHIILNRSVMLIQRAEDSVDS